MRRTNLLAMAIAAAAIITAECGVRSRRQSDKPEISALQGSKHTPSAARGRWYSRSQIHCVSRVVPSVAAMRHGDRPKSRRASPQASSEASTTL